MDQIRTTAFSRNDFGLSAAMALVYFFAIMAVIGIVVWLISKVVFYYE